ncbi:MAG: UMP kinase [Promethearchaeati archaeon]
MNNKNIVIKIGGSLLFDKNKQINSKKITEFCDLVKENKNYDAIIIIVGGGIIAREYLNFIRKYTQNEALADLVGIYFSQINAKLLISYFKDLAYPLVPKNIDELSVALLSKKIIIMGGLQPGQSTTSVALEVAEFIKAKQTIILTNVNGIYNKDPKKHKDAKLLEHLNYSELSEIILKESDINQAAAGEYRIFDAVSLQILKRSHLKVQIGSGLDLSKFQELWLGNIQNIGTVISD